MKHTELAARLFCAVVKGELTAEAAASQLEQAFPSKKKPCKIGKGGVCLTHGNTIEECEAVSLR